MDLLRLVLAHQPGSRLVGLSRLADSKRFLRVRAEVLQLEGEFDSLMEMSIAGADPIPGMRKGVDIKQVLARTCFCRDPIMFRYYCQIPKNMEADFWCAIGTDVPEIQQAAIEQMKSLASFDTNAVMEILEEIADPSTISWTADLKNSIKDLITFITNRRHGRGTLLPRVIGMTGTLLKPSKFQNGARFQTESFKTYMLAIVRSILNYDELALITTPATDFLSRKEIKDAFRPTSDFFVESGLGALILPSCKDPKIAENAFYVGLQMFNYKFLRCLLDTGFMKSVNGSFIPGPDPNFVSRRAVENARKCLDDPEISSLMGYAMHGFYQSIAGDVAVPIRMPYITYINGRREHKSNHGIVRFAAKTTDLRGVEYYAARGKFSK